RDPLVTGVQTCALPICALDELDERRRLRDVRECERPTTGERSLERGMEMQMQSLRFARARAAEADGGREQPTQAKMQERRERFEIGRASCRERAEIWVM